MIGRLVLGTVQLGLKYGINNKYGKPSLDYSFRLLDKAYELGIRIFDTAFAYGDAEEVLGNWISTNGIPGDVKIISKLKPNIFDEEELSRQVIRDQVRSSLERLKIDSLDGYLLHTPSYVYKDIVMEGMLDCKNEGLIKNCGVSIYEEKDALYAAKHRLVDYIQVPYSLLDQRLDKTDFFEIAKSNNKTIFARSPFVQGLVFMDNESIPPHLNKAKDYLESLDIIIAKYKITRLTASMLFSLYNTGNDYVVFGVDTLEQLVDDCNAALSNTQFIDCINMLKVEFGVTEKSIVIPSLWVK